MQIQGTIQSVTPKKSGTSQKDGRTFNWTIYEVMINGQRFSTFDDSYLKMVGQNGTYDYESETVNKNGKTFTNSKLANIKKAGGNALKEVHEKLDKIIALLENSAPQGQADNFVEPVAPPQEDEIDVDSIPF